MITIPNVLPILTLSLIFIGIICPHFAFAQEEDEDVWAMAEQNQGAVSSALSGDFQNRTTVDLVNDNEVEDFFTTRELLYAKGSFTFSDRFSVTLSGLAEYMFRGNSEGHENGARYRADLEELFTDLHLGKVDLRLGQQIVTWGKTDVFSPTDTINSQDYRYVIDTELGHVKIPNLMAKVDYYPDKMYLEGIFIPFFRPAKIDFIGGDWALFGNRAPVTMLTGYLDETKTGRDFLAFMNRLMPDWDEQLEETLSSERLNALGPSVPDDDFQYWEAGGRLGFVLGPTDTSLSYFYCFDDMPTLYFHEDVRALFVEFAEGETEPEITDILPLLQDHDLDELYNSKYERLHQLGADFSANLGPSVIRAEGTYVLGRKLYTTDLEPIERPMITYTAGGDLTPYPDVTFNLQVLQAITQYYTEELLNEEAYTFLISFIQGAFLEGKLDMYAQILYDVTAWNTEKWRKGKMFGEDFEFTSRISYDVLPDLELGIGAVVFGGPRDQLLALVHDKNFGYFDLKYSF